MGTGTLGGVIRHLRRAVLLRDGGGLTDGQLLQQYLDQRDEAAFEALVRRHGPMVLGVCRRVLHHAHDADDAFQAAFLVLVRKAASVAPRELVGHWLYGVAYRTAMKAKAMSARRQAKERQVRDVPQQEALEEDAWQDLQPLLDQELNRLPEKYQAPLVLCYLHGKCKREVARQLGLPEGTVSSRLARARKMLRQRLAHRGLALTVGSLAVALSVGAASASVPAPLVGSTVEAAALFAAGKAATGVISVKVAALTEGVLKTMWLTKLKIATAVLVGMAVMLVLAAPGMLTFAQQDAGKPTAKPAAPTPQDKPEGKKEKAGWRELFVLKHEHPVNIVACSADWIAAGDEGGNLFFYDAKTGNKGTLQLKGGKEKGLNTSIDRLQFTPDGKHLFVVMSELRGMMRFNLDPKADKRHPGLMGKDPRNLGTSADGEFWLELQSANKRLALRPNSWTRGATVEYESILYEADISHAVLSADDKWLAVVTADENLRIHDRASLKETQTISLAKQTVNAIQFSKDGKRLAVVGPNGFAKVYDSESGKEVATLKGHGGIHFCVAFSPDGKTVVTGGDDNVARVWDAATGNSLAVLEGHKDSVRSVTFDPSGEMLITGSADKTVKSWKLAK